MSAGNPSAGAEGVTLGELAQHCGAELRGDASILIRQVAALDQAGPGEISFLANSRYRMQLTQTRASAVILSADCADTTTVSCLVSANPYACYARASRFLNPEKAPNPGIHPSAVIGEGSRVPGSCELGALVTLGQDVVLGEGVVIAPGCVIGDRVVIGAGGRIHPNVVIYPDCRIGMRVVLHAGAVVGADGFGFAGENGTWQKIPQIGRVVIGDDVEIGANTSIDRGALGDTLIGDGVKLDNLIQIAHNVEIGAHTAMAACVGIAGSAKIGRGCTVGGAAVVLGHLELVDDVHVSAGTMITKSIRQAGTYTSAPPFMPHGQWLKNAAHLRHLDALARRISELEAKLAKQEEPAS